MSVFSENKFNGHYFGDDNVVMFQEWQWSHIWCWKVTWQWHHGEWSTSKLHL